MKIMYIWHSEPKRRKVYDTEKSFERTPSVFKKQGCQQEVWDKQELESIERNKQNGKVLEYKVIG